MTPASKLFFIMTLAALASCAALGLSAPVGRAVPLMFKQSDEHGRCAVSGYEVDFAPHVTVATLASVCVRPFDAGAAADASESPPRAPPHLSPPIQTFPPQSSPDGGLESASDE